ncbi:unnamed protein product [Prorocentrum cordatum]|uniref:Uncharacterized protein n=1 Tax=Prorocentrum cordatum TaxID=2364126 RepID=A0ABN9RC11_9DINO|nr:unnamed protein product [Polarella glacialis]
MTPKRKRKDDPDDGGGPPPICGLRAISGPIFVSKGAGKGGYQIGPKQEFGLPPQPVDGKPPKKKPNIGCGICSEKTNAMETACTCGKCSGTHKFAFPFWGWDTLTDQYHSNEKVKAGFDNSHHILHKQGGVKPEMESEESVGEKSGLFQDTSGVIAYYKKPPSEIDMKPASIVDQSGALRNVFVQVSPDQPHTVVNIYRRRELHHSMLAMPTGRRLSPQQGAIHMQSLIENRCADLRALFNAPTHEDILGRIQDKATVEEIAAKNDAPKSRSSGSAPSSLPPSGPSSESVVALADGAAAAGPTEAASVHEATDPGEPRGPPASTLVKMNASALSQLGGSSPGGASSLRAAVSAVGGGGGSVVSSVKASSFDDGEAMGEGSEETDKETSWTTGRRRAMHNCRIHRLPAGKKAGHTVRRLRDNASKHTDDPDHSVASTWLNLAERCKVAGDQNAKIIRTMNGDELAKLADDIDKNVPRVPVGFQRALRERALEDWENGQEWGSKPGQAIAMCLPWPRESGDVDYVVKSECAARALALMILLVPEKAAKFKGYLCKITLSRFLRRGKDGRQRTVEFVAAAMGAIKAMPMTCEIEVDSAAAEVAAVLQLMCALGQQAEDALNLAAVGQLGKSKSTAVEGAVYAVVSNEPCWEVKLKDYLKFSPGVKKWRPIMSKHLAALQSEGPPTYKTPSSVAKDLPIIKAVLPEVEYSSFFQVSRGALGRFFEHIGARVNDGPREATDEFSDNVEALSQKAAAIFGFHSAWSEAVGAINSCRSRSAGKNLVVHFCGELGVFNLDILVYGLSQFDEAEGPGDLVPELPMQQLISFAKQAVEWVTKKRSNSLDVSRDPLFDSSLRRVSTASAWLEWSCVSPVGSGFKSFEQLVGRAKLAKTLVGAMATIVPRDPSGDFSDADAAAAPDHSVDAFLGLLTQCEALKEAPPEGDAAVVNGAFMGALAAESAMLLSESASVLLSKLKGGLLDRDWRDGVSPSIAFDALLDIAGDFLKGMPRDPLKAEVEFNIYVTNSAEVDLALARLQRAATTVLEYAVVYGASEIKGNAVVLKKYLTTVEKNRQSWGVEKLFEPVQLAMDKGIAMQNFM